MSQDVLDSLAQAAAFYRGQLIATPRAIAYLKARGISGDTAARYGLGYASPLHDGLRGAFGAYNDPVLVKAGLVAHSDACRRYDRFRDRIMFPICADSGDVLGFGGRLLEGDGPKYLNSPETEVFQKGSILFGLNQAAEAIAATSTVFVVEGYMDVVSLAQHGVRNAVATLGTATTPQHVERLLKLGARIVFCFDGDDAGRRAAAKALDVCLSHLSDSTDIAFLFLPKNHDPDSFVRAKGADAFCDLGVEAASLEGFFVANAMQGCQLEYDEGRARMIAVASPGLHRIKPPALLLRILDGIALATGMSVAELIFLCGLDGKPGL